MNPRIPALLCSLLFTAFLTAAPDDQPDRAPELPESLVQARTAADTGDYEKAAALLKEAAANGNADAAFGLAEFYILGRGVEASAVEALKYYEQAGEAGIAGALFRQGELYLLGAKGVDADVDRGLFLLNSAAEEGIAGAWTVLGNRSEAQAHAANAAPERERLFAEARKYQLRGAEAGSLESQEIYARLLINGLGGDAAPRPGLVWLKKAALGGRSTAMNELGLLYQRGTGNDDDPITALGWFLAGAERGSLPAMTNLGICYAKGLGVPQNHDMAGSWLAKASKQHFAPAQLLLGQMFEEGLGTTPNPVFAMVNYSRAAKSGLEAAIASRDALKPKLSAEQLKEVEKLLNPKSPPAKAK